MPAIRDEAAGQAGDVERAPQNVVGPVEGGRAAIAEMCEADRPCGGHAPEDVRRGIGVADGDSDAEFARGGESGQPTVDLRGHCEEEWVGASQGAQLGDAFRRRLDHLVGGVRSAEAGLG